jgi:tRNA-modifying protein YgfZ
MTVTVTRCCSWSNKKAVALVIPASTHVSIANWVSHVPDARASYDALRHHAGAVWLRRDVVRARGAEVASYLQGQVSQDVDAIAVGQSAYTWVLQPHGKVDVLARLNRVAADDFIIDVDAGFAPALVERMNRFKLRTKVAFETLDWKMLAIRGDEVTKPDVANDDDVVIAVDWAHMRGFDVIGADPAVPANVPLVDREAYEALRIEAGVPEMGPELDERTIPAEAEINDRTISFTKGCYTGQ